MTLRIFAFKKDKLKIKANNNYFKYIYIYIWLIDYDKWMYRFPELFLCIYAFLYTVCSAIIQENVIISRTVYRFGFVICTTLITNNNDDNNNDFDFAIVLLGFRMSHK